MKKKMVTAHIPDQWTLLQIHTNNINVKNSIENILNTESDIGVHVSNEDFPFD